MKNLRNKTKDQGGFTLIEMLVVVAIIAILIAVSIPLVTEALERARVATDAANERSAKAEAMILYLSEDDLIFKNTTPTVNLFYDAENGVLVEKSGLTDVDGYGKCTQTHESGAGPHRKGIIRVTITVATGEITVTWVSEGATGSLPGGAGTPHNMDIDPVKSSP